MCGAGQGGLGERRVARGDGEDLALGDAPLWSDLDGDFHLAARRGLGPWEVAGAGVSLRPEARARRARAAVPVCSRISAALRG